MSTATARNLSQLAVIALSFTAAWLAASQCNLEPAHAATSNAASPWDLWDTAPPSGAIGSAADGAADATVTVWRAGWGAILVMAGFYAAGAIAAYKRGYIVRRWPRLDVSRAWAALSVALGIVATLIQIGIAGDLDSDAIQKQLAFAFGLFAQGNMSAIIASGAAKRETLPPPARAADGAGAA